MRIAPLGLILLLTSIARLHAASYFVDYAEGADGNSGVNRNLAWKHCPGDPAAEGIAASQALSAGDTVYFKGGVNYVFSGATGIGLNWSGESQRVITYDGNKSGTWGTGRAKFTDNRGGKAIAAFSSLIPRHHLTFSFLDIGAIGGAAAPPSDLGYPVASRPGAGIVFGGGAESVLVDGCIFHEIGFWFNQKPMNAASLAGTGFSSTRCRDVTISNCDFSRMAVACDLSKASELLNLQIVGCSFRDSILWQIDLPPWVGSAPNSVVAVSESTFFDGPFFRGAAWGGYGNEPRLETVTATLGTTVTFAAVATASPTAAFQWQKNGAHIIGATGTELRLVNLGMSDAATYTVVATNAAGAATSNAVALVVGGGVAPPPSGGLSQVAPAITAQPQSQTVSAGASVTLTAAASGTPAPTIVWYRNGLTFGGWTGATLRLESVTSNDTGAYTVVATNAAGVATSNAVTLVVGGGVAPPPSGGLSQVAPAITAQPQSQTVSAGASVMLTAAASGTPAPSYQWQKNTVAIAGATNATLNLNSVTAGDSGSYILVATNLAGVATSNATMVTVNAVGSVGDIVTGLIAHWKLDETGGPTAGDASGQGQTATLVNGPTWGAGRVSGAVQLDGGNDYVQLPAAPFGNYPSAGAATNYQRTFAVWFKTTGSGVILGQTDVGTPVGGWPSGYVPALYLDGSGRLRGSMFWHGAVEVQNVSANAYNDGAWHHVVNTYANGTETLYVDGVGVGSQAVSEYGYNSGYAYYLGTGFTASWPMGSGGWSYFSGSLDEVRLYDRALAAADVAALWAYAGSVNVGPAITQQPASQTVSAGANVTLVVGGTSPIPAATEVASSSLPQFVFRSLTLAMPAVELGFVVERGGPKRILIRAAGPTLNSFAVPDFLTDPVLELFQGAISLQRNDDWGGSAEIAAGISRLGIFPFASAMSKDAALLVTLPAGEYRVVTKSGDAHVGMVIIEVRELPSP